MRIILLLFSGLTFVCSALGQVDFRQANYLIHNQKIRSTLSLGVADMNGDYQDDVVLLDQGTDLIIGYQSAPGVPFTLVETGSILANPAWALSLGDLDNDGVSEIFTCGINTFGNVYKKTPSGIYGFKQLLFGLTFPQNSNMADIDNNGWLDAFVCDERAYNDLYLNDGTGNLVYNDYIDMNTVPPSDNSGNYGSEWVDFDDDGDIDLFITKCKPAITDPDDPLRLNVLFVNDGQGQYAEMAEQFGLKHGAQSWTGSFGDLDNDGDLDCFVSNHDTTHFIYENIDNDTFIDVTSQWMTPLLSSSIQAAIRDFDNNGYMDIYVSGDRDFMLWNQGDKTMIVEKDPLGVLEVFTFATGDLNGDGFLDVVASHGGLNFPGSYDDILWLNRANDNHYLKISFWGDESNRKGVGAKVKVFSTLGTQTRDVKIGESYGTTNSGNVHFGLGNVEVVDSMHVFWPSGTIDRFHNVEADQHLLVHEGKCMSTFFDIVYQGDNVLCSGESLELEVPGNFDQYIWSTGETTPTITVDGETEVSFRGVDENGCIHHSNVLKILYEPDETPVIEFAQGGPVNCAGSTVWLRAPEAFQYSWSNGAETQLMNVTGPGSFRVTIRGHCAQFTSEWVDVDFFTVDPPVLPADTILLKEPAPVLLEAEGINLHWYLDNADSEPLVTGSFNTDTIDRDTVFYVADFDQHIAALESVGMKDHQGTALGGASLNSGLIFNCFAAFTLEQVRVITDVPGYRTIELKQFEEDTGEERLLQSKRVFVEAGEQSLELDFPIAAGLGYILTTNPDTNLLHLGAKSPGFYRSNVGVFYPYTLDGILEITTSLHGPDYYYYFFDWQVRPESISCFSERVPVYIVLDTITTLIVYPEGGTDWMIHPNPARDRVVLSGPDDDLVVYGIRAVLYNDLGQRLSDQRVSGRKTVFELSGLPSGMYWIEVRELDNRVLFRGKLIVQRE